MTPDISRIAYTNAPDIIVIVSGDSDFIPIVLDLCGRGIRVEVAAFNVAMSAQLALKSSGFISPDAISNDDFSAPEESAENASDENFDADAELNRRLDEFNHERVSFETSDDGDKFKSVPDRTKASDATYFGYKEPWRKEVITQQVLELSQRFFKGSPVEPQTINMKTIASFVPMMPIFPDRYPDLPTNGFYLPASLQIPDNAQHFYDRGYGGAAITCGTSSRSVSTC